MVLRRRNVHNDDEGPTLGNGYGEG